MWKSFFKKLSVPEQHQYNIARKTLKMSCVAVKILGGPNHHEAVEIIAELTGHRHPVPFDDCTCEGGN